MKCTLRRSTLGPKAKPMGMQMPSASSKNWVFLPKRLPRRRRCLQNLQTSNFHRHPRTPFFVIPASPLCHPRAGGDLFFRHPRAGGDLFFRHPRTPFFVIPARPFSSSPRRRGSSFFRGFVRFFSVILFLFFYKMGRKKGCSSLFSIKKVTRVT